MKYYVKSGYKCINWIIVTDLLVFQLCLSSMMRVCSGYRRGSSCPKVLAVYGCNGKQMIGDSDLFYKLQSLHTNWLFTSKYFTSISPSWQYGSDCCLHEDVISSSWCLSDSSQFNDFLMKMLCLQEEQHRYIFFFFQLAYIVTQLVNQKVILVLLLFYVNPSIIIILASLIYTRAADFYVNRTDKMKLLSTVICFPYHSSLLLQ